MSNIPYRTEPERSGRMPSCLPFLIVNEAAERFSFYGMRTILVIFMTQYLLNADGTLDVMSEPEARSYYHLFTSAVYFFPVIGALIADIWLGKYRTIMSLSLVYCLGHLALAMDQTRVGLAVGLTLIAVGSGGIKPCVSANLGDQFSSTNSHLLSKAFYWFYFAINFGAGLSTLLTPWLLNHIGPHLAFGVPGLLMLLATWVFWLGRRDYVHIPARGKTFLRELLTRDSLLAMWRLTPIYLFVAVFWALYDQTGSAWVLQARNMDLYWMGVEWLPSQIQFVNPFLIMLLIPVFAYGVYPAMDKVFPLTPLRKISIGFFMTVIAFVISAVIEMQIVSGLRPNIVVANRGVRGDHRGGGHGLDHVFGIFLHPGAQGLEIVCHGALSPVGVPGERLYLVGEFFHSERRRQRVAGRPGLLLVFHVGHARRVDSLYRGGQTLQRPNLSSGRGRMIVGLRLRLTRPTRLTTPAWSFRA